MYDPARDVFQPPEDIASEDLEPTEKAHTLPHEDTSEPIVDSAAQLQSSTMALETSKKRQRSPSPTAKPVFPEDEAAPDPPNKKRRSSGPLQPSIPSPVETPLDAPKGSNHTSSSASSATKEFYTELKSASTENATFQRIEDRQQTAGTEQSGKQDTDRSQAGAEGEARGNGQARIRQPPEKARDAGRKDSQPRRYRSRSPVNRRPTTSGHRSVYSRRDPAPPPRRSRSPSPISRSPPRDNQSLKRPGGGTGRGRNVLAIAQRLAEEREQEQQAQNALIQRERGTQQVSNQFYNARPEWVKERGRDWRKNESKIKGLRSFNNWIKSCIIQKFSPDEAPQLEELGWGEEAKAPTERKPLLVLDIGCGKGGDLGKWQLAPQTVGLYVGLDPADQSVAQAHDRYAGMRRGRKPIFDGRFHVKDCFGEWVGDVPIVREIGIDPNVGNGGPSRWSGGGFDVVTMMFSMHYAFESEQKARTMLRNVAGSLKKGGRFIGVVPNSDAISERVVSWWKAHSNGTDKSDNNAENAASNAKAESDDSNKKNSTNGEPTNESRTGDKKTPDTKNPDQVHQNPPTNADTTETTEPTNPAQTPSWGNSIYTVRFTNTPPPHDGIFRNPPFGWKYMYWMSEAVDVPEYVVPWEAFRALAEGYNLEQRYRKPFLDVWEAEGRVGRGGDSGAGAGAGAGAAGTELRRLAERMGVCRRDLDGRGGGGGGRDGDGLCLSDEEREAVGFYHAFCFVKV